VIGQKLSHFRVIEQLGAGGMGVVYRAWDEHLQRDVAIKVLPAGALEDDAARRRFRKEALALSKLNHPHICTVYDFDTEEGVDFLVMEYVEGETLAGRLRREPLQEAEVVRIGRQVGEALNAAHERAIIHRDLKPGNIMVTAKGEAKVLDFGLAKEQRLAGFSTSTDPLTGASEVVGTLPYMAPEQLLGTPADVRSDIYALGVVLYEMATGSLPFDRSHPAALVDAILHRQPISPRKLNQSLSRGLEAVILRCLEKKPTGRYPSVREVNDALGQSDASPRLAEVMRGTWRRHGSLLGASAGVLLLGVAIIALQLTGTLGRWTGGSTQAIRALAVLPLQDLSGDPSQNYFADGMTEEVIVALSRIPSLRVISRQSVMGFRGSNISVRKIASSLGVDAVVIGSVLRVGDRVRITSKLIQADPEQHLWAESYEGSVGEVMLLQARLARDIADKIGARLTPGQRASLAASRTVNPEAHDEYLKGRSVLEMFTLTKYREGLQHLTKAVTVDPTFAQGWAGLADCYYALSGLYVPADEAMAKSRAAALRAISIDSTLAEAHVALGTVYAVYDRNWTLAEREYRRAIDLNPSHAGARASYASQVLLTHGRFEEMMEQHRRAHELDPLSLGIEGAGLAFGDYLAGQYDRSLARFRGLAGQEPDNPVWHWSLGLCYEEKGMFSEAIAEHKRAVSLADSEGAGPIVWGAKALLSRSYALANHGAEARVLLRSIEDNGGISPYLLGTVYVALGEADRAFEWFDRAYRAHDEEMNNFKVDPKVRALHSDPRYHALLRKMGFEP
jgi:eukaryotic-like serine/threonine-protein kinase